MSKETKEVVQRIVPKLSPANLKPAEFERAVYIATVPQGVTIQDCLDESFWAHVADKTLRPLDRIEVHAEDASWYAELLVRSSTRLRAQVAVLNHVVLDEMSLSDSGEAYAVEWISPSVRYGVVRKSDKQRMRDEGFQTREEAASWLADNLRELAS